ncbi:MAG: hypothetical protein L7G99_03055 [Vulcanisaeta sp.]|nr:hypothetical protein [Vulcanisaeta sp.]
MYYDEIQQLINRASLYMFVSTIATLIAVMLVIMAANFLSNQLPPSIAVEYFQALSFPGLNVVTGLITLSSIMAVVGGFVIYIARSSLNRREFMGLPSIITTGLTLLLIALLSSVGIYIVYQYYVGKVYSNVSAIMLGPLMMGTLSLFISIALLLISLILTYLSLTIVRKLRRKYAPRRIRRRQPPPPPTQ